MKTKRLTAVCLLCSALIILSCVSCSHKIKNSAPDDSEADNSYTSSDTSLPETSSVTATSASEKSHLQAGSDTQISAAVTDKNGNTVTNSDGSVVTEIIKPEQNDQTSVPDSQQTQKPADNTVSESHQAGIQQPSEPDIKTVKMTWLCEGKQNTLPIGSGQLAVLTFKIKDNAPNGDYNIDLSHGNDSDTGSFVKFDSTKKYSNLDGGIISIGSQTPRDDNPSPDDYDTYANLSNTCGNPGDTVTIYLNVENIHKGIGAVSLKIGYDASVMDITGFGQGSVFDSISKGTFMTNPSIGS